jgi:hypothetical protein
MDIIKNPNGHLAHLNGNRGPRLAPTLAQAEMHARAQAAQRRNTTAVSPPMAMRAGSMPKLAACATVQLNAATESS